MAFHTSCGKKSLTLLDSTMFMETCGSGAGTGTDPIRPTSKKIQSDHLPALNGCSEAETLQFPHTCAGQLLDMQRGPETEV